ncbi:MAG: hypothetical protein LBH24_04945 [Clostridiales bacterium]|jgi:hypothetical protein|nr:hypothetical protein [Clostridiales bacterium]
MFVCAEVYKDVSVGELIVLKQDEARGGIGAYLITGEKVGNVTGRQPAGCVDFWTVAAAAAKNRVLCTASILCGRVLIATSDSKALDKPIEYGREEIEGYGMMTVLSARS